MIINCKYFYLLLTKKYIELIFNYLIPTEVFASAPDDTSTYGIISVVENKENVDSITATYANGIVSFTGSGLYSDEDNNQIYATGNVTVEKYFSSMTNYYFSYRSNGIKIRNILNSFV